MSKIATKFAPKHCCLEKKISTCILNCIRNGYKKKKKKKKKKKENNPVTGKGLRISVQCWNPYTFYPRALPNAKYTQNEAMPQPALTTHPYNKGNASNGEDKRSLWFSNEHKSVILIAESKGI